MPATETTSIPSRESAPARRLIPAIAALLLRAGRRWQRSRAINELAMLDDRQLADIGITRNDIPRVVDGLLGSEKIQNSRPPRSAAPENAIIAAASYKRAA